VPSYDHPWPKAKGSTGNQARTRSAEKQDYQGAFLLPLSCPLHDFSQCEPAKVNPFAVYGGLCFRLRPGFLYPVPAYCHYGNTPGWHRTLLQADLTGAKFILTQPSEQFDICELCVHVVYFIILVVFFDLSIRIPPQRQKWVSSTETHFEFIDHERL
jgi:hypothetical protein